MHEPILTYEQHYQRARTSVRRLHGFVDAIHYAPDWKARADALFRTIDELGWYVPGDGLGLLADGRMACTVRRPLAEVDLFTVAEPIGSRE